MNLRGSLQKQGKEIKKQGEELKKLRGSLQKQVEELKSLREENSNSKKITQYFNFEFEGDNKTNPTYGDSTLFNFGDSNASFSSTTKFEDNKTNYTFGDSGTFGFLNSLIEGKNFKFLS